ncbi:hypothetical protein U6B65_01555 [Oscillospiraceae bacterium MB08-C2-2]|nr:hypothetical protein U6B65_01555 [Oscillospiraceae bacterium MB08-C2-2]
MEIAKILLITILGAVAIGVIGGLLVGKYIVNRKNRKPLLSRKELILYCTCVLVGIALVLTGVFYAPAGEGDMTDPSMMNSGMTGGEISEGEMGIDVAVDAQEPQTDDALPLPETAEDENADTEDAGETADATESSAASSEAADAPAAAGSIRGGTAVARASTKEATVVAVG